MQARERYQELCRLCASYDAVKMDIFGHEGRNRQLVDKIQTCLPFKITETDRLPKCLCYRCMYNLENFYDFRTACVNAVAMLERCLPSTDSTGECLPNCLNHNEWHPQLLKGKENMPVLIPEAPVVNPNAALGTPPRLNSDGEADHEIEEALDNSVTDEATVVDELEDRRSEEYEMDMETNPTDFLEMTPMVTEESEEPETRAPREHPPVFQPTPQQHEVYVCSLCNKAFSSKGHLSLHARIHVGAGDVIGEKVLTDDHTSYKRPYQCDLCNKSYSTAKHRWGHVSTTHRGHPAVTCGYCSRIYSTRTNLEEHIKSRHGGLALPNEITINTCQTENRYQCKICGKYYSDSGEFSVHERTCHEQPRIEISGTTDKKHKVDTSETSSATSDDENKDYRTAEAKLAKNPQLTILKQALTKGESLKRDYEDKRSNCKPQKLPRTDSCETTIQKKWYCESCPQSFTTVEGLKEHEHIHDAEKPFICILCKKDFAFKPSLSRHILSLHGIDPTPIVDSEMCLKKVVDAQARVENRGTEIVQNSILKSVVFPVSSQANLENDEEDPESNHENMIEIETVFVCEICTRDFNDRASLWLHIRATHKEYAAFACGVCLKICSDNTQLLNHVNMYHGGSKLLVSEQRRYSCTICGRQHDSRKKLIAHVSIHNVDPAYDPANFVQLNSNYYNENINGAEAGEHMLDYDAEDGDKVDCYICYKSFPNEDHLIRHQRNAHKSEQSAAIGDAVGNGNQLNLNGNGNRAQYHLFFVCELCGSSHHSKWERWLHVSSAHSNEPSIKCDREDCGKIFATKSLRNDHTQHHALQGSSPNTCEICGKLWGSRVDYWKHVMGVHSDTVPLICGVCLKVFPDVVQLSSHVRSKHWPLTNGDFSCDICGRPYSNKSKMSRHRKIHGVEVDYDNGSLHETTDPRIDRVQDTDLSCELCEDLKFANLEKLCNHRRIAHGLFPCDLCNKCYGRTSHLWKHVNRVHKGHEDVTCPYCLKTSASKDHLAAHIAKIHRYEPDARKGGKPERKYKTEDVGLHYCEKCNKGFHKRYLLRRHMKGCQNYRKDPGALLTRCRACERIFKDRASLQKHIENHHSTYTCHLCNETITSKLGIMTHNRVNHMNHPDLTCDFGSCRKLFRTKEDLEAHRKDHRYHTNPNVCDFCGDTVENKLKLKMHVLSLHRNEIGVSCGVCLIPMKDPKELKKHVEEVHFSVLSKPNTCQVCGKQYASKWKAFDHTKKCHGKVFRTCKQCLAVFTEDSLIRDHYEMVHNVPKDQLAAFEYRLDIGQKPEDFEAPEIVVKEEPEDLEYDVDLCDEDSNDSKRRRSLTDTFDCEMCPEIFLNSETLSKHYQNVHNTDPDRLFKKFKQDEHRKRGKKSFFCKNCNRGFSTRTLFWSHIGTCRKNMGHFPREGMAAPEEDYILKNNNQIKTEELSTNLNIPDFNLFEDINLQLSGQKPLPSLMPLSRMKSSIKCSRKDSRKVYDESTNTECACEVCGKQWPAKKHLWQHLIRFHRAEAAVTCGVCLKLCKDYDDLANHLKATHEAILSCEGNNFTCKTCGRYHNARSKLLLHMSIHIGCNGQTWCEKCQRNFVDQAEHEANCTGRVQDPQEEKIQGDENGSLIADDSMIQEAEEGEFESEAEADTEDSESTSSSEEEENESEGESRVTGEITYNSESEDSELENVDMEHKEMEECYGLEQLEETKTEEKSDIDLSEDEGPPVLSPMMPLSRESKTQDQPMDGTHLSIQLKKDVEMCENSDHTGNASPKSETFYDKQLANSETCDMESEKLDSGSEDEDSDDEQMEAKNESDEESDEDMSEKEESLHEKEMSGKDELVHEEMSEDDEVDHEDEMSEEEEVVHEEEMSEEDEIVHEEEMSEEEEIVHEEMSEKEEVVDEEEMSEKEEMSDKEEVVDQEEVQNLDGTILLVANNDEGNQILVEQEVLDEGDDEDSNQEFVYSSIRYSSDEENK